jgi:acyl-coenzyme A synthetase/AMP-(fatty) acid ligase
MKEIGFGVLPIRVGNWYFLRNHCPLVSGVTSIIDEAEFDATDGILYSKSKVTTWYTTPTAIRRLMGMEDIKPKEASSLEISDQY